MTWGRERERHKSVWRPVTVDDRQHGAKAGAAATWDPHTRPIITEYAGQVKFENVEKA